MKDKVTDYIFTSKLHHFQHGHSKLLLQKENSLKKLKRENFLEDLFRDKKECFYNRRR